MYLLDTQTEISFVLGTTPNAWVIGDFATVTVEPDGSTTYAAITDFVAPTVTTEGLVTHLVTPDSEGLWEITLVKGPVDTYTELSRAMLYVFDNETDVQARTYSEGSLDVIGV